MRVLLVKVQWFVGICFETMALEGFRVWDTTEYESNPVTGGVC